MADKFWMVFSVNEAPRVYHPSFEEAVPEAERIAHKHPDCKVYILEAVRCFETEAAPIVSYSLNMPGPVQP